MTTYVIKSWHAETSANGTDGNFVTIEGRAGGFISWLLSLLGISPIVSIKVNQDKIYFTEGSLEGFSNRIIPLKNVCSTFYGYRKPWKEAVILGIILGAPTLGIGAIFAVIYYFLNKTLTFGFVETSGVVSAISFKRSVIENKKLEEADARHVCEITQWLIDQKTPS